MSELLALLLLVFIERRRSTIIYMYDCWNDNEKQSRNFIYSLEHVQQQLTVLSNAF